MNARMKPRDLCADTDNLAPQDSDSKAAAGGATPGSAKESSNSKILLDFSSIAAFVIKLSDVKGENTTVTT